ncbi:MAG TPA: M1 family aminopeptidase, partial [Allosphingosinicella sp.]
MLRVVLPLASILFAPAALAADVPAKIGAGFDVERYSVSLVPEPATKSVSGRERIEFRSLTPDLRTLSFSPNALTIESATLDGRPVRVSSDKASIRFELPRPIGKGRSATLSFRYHGVPARGVTATAASMYTSYFACDWMVCLQDAPGDKADFTLELRLQRGMSSLSVGRLVRTVPAPDGTTVHRWRTTRPYSAYLFGFAVGPFIRAIEKAEGAELTYLGEGASAPELRRLFAETPAMVRFLSDKAGVKLPDGRYAQLLVQGREAQEAATYALIGKGELDRSVADPQSGWVIVHELAHMWWGNLVTTATWRDFWLNE